MRYFRRSEFNDFEMMDKEFLRLLDEFREFVGKPVIVHSDYRTNSSRHVTGMAVDIHISGMNVLDQLLIAERFQKFSGIGIYPCWHNPGLHVDTVKPGRWLAYNSGNGQTYTGLNTENIMRYVMPLIKKAGDSA